MGKVWVVTGLIMVIIGVLLMFKVPLPFGRLPGDLVIKGEHVQFYFPIVTCLLVSVVLSLLFYFLQGR